MKRFGFQRGVLGGRKLGKETRERLQGEEKERLEEEKRRPPRPATAEELDILRWLLEHGTPEARTFAPQLENLRAKRSCSCGCPSIALHVDSQASSGTSSSRVIADATGMTSGGCSVGLILFQDGGRLSELEVYPFGEIDGEFGSPTLESLSIWEESSANIEGKPS